MHLKSAIELNHLFTTGALSATEITKTFISRIEKLDPQVGAFISTCPEKALAKAQELDLKKAQGKPLGRLAGVPVGIKDNIHVKGEITTCASQFLKNYRANFDATVTELIEREDGIIIGKTNLDEFAMGSSCENSSIKISHNPWDLKCVPGGSSGGSAAAVAARFCPITLGSDTGGSIRLPASFCGIVGYKPTYGRVSRYGLVAYGSSLDQVGPMTTTVADSALMMEILGRHCHRDSNSINQKPDEILNSLNSFSMQGVKIGIPWQLLEGIPAEALAHFKSSIDVYRSLGAQIIDGIDLSMLKHSIAVYYILATAEASTNLARFDGIRYGVRSNDAQNLEQIYELSRHDGFGAEVKRRILLGTYVLSAGYQDAYYKKAQKVRTLLINQYKENFKRCDIIAMPVSPVPAFEIGQIKDPLQMYLLDIFTISQNLVGLPAISVPSGFSQDHKPIGLQLVAPQLKDKLVLQAAHAFEKHTGYSQYAPEWITREHI